MKRSLLAILAVLAVAFARAEAVRGDDDADEQALRAANLSSDGPVLLDYLRKQTTLAARPDQIRELIRDLGADDYFARQKASASLVALGRVALSFLHDAADAKDQDPEVRHRANECVALIEQGTVASLPIAVVRLVGKKKPAGAAEALLAYLPVAEHEGVAQEARNALTAVAVRDGELDPAVKSALATGNPVQRAAAAEAAYRAGGTADKTPALALLKDRDPAVRLHLALALVTLKERQAVPALIDVLGELKPEELRPAEAVLRRLAEDKAPDAPLGENETSRKRCRDAWAAWWKDHGAAADLGKLRLLGHTVVVLLDRNTVMELDGNNAPVWKITAQFPLDVQPIGGDRVLLAEQGANRVTERDRKGAVLWEKQIDQPLVAQRLPNGNTFIANHQVLMEVDRKGQPVYTHTLPGGAFVMRAQKLPNGDIACISRANVYLRLDAKGNIRRSFPALVDTSGGRIEVLPNGHVLVPHMSQDRVVEYDESGRVVRQLSVPQPIAAVRLANGNTMVTSMSQNRAIELDRSGKEVWTFRADSRVTRAVRR